MNLRPAVYETAALPLSYVGLYVSRDGRNRRPPLPALGGSLRVGHSPLPRKVVAPLRRDDVDQRSRAHLNPSYDNTKGRIQPPTRWLRNSSATLGGSLKMVSEAVAESNHRAISESLDYARDSAMSVIEGLSDTGTIAVPDCSGKNSMAGVSYRRGNAASIVENRGGGDYE